MSSIILHKFKKNCKSYIAGQSPGHPAAGRGAGDMAGGQAWELGFLPPNSLKDDFPAPNLENSAKNKKGTYYLCNITN